MPKVFSYLLVLALGLCLVPTAEAVMRPSFEQAKRKFQNGDKNGDGVIVRSEASLRFKTFGFAQMDANHDDQVTYQELLDFYGQEE